MPRPTVPSSADAPNDAGLYVIGAPTGWWHPGKMPKQAAALTAYLVTMLPPGQRGNGALLFGPYGGGKSSGAIGLLYAWGRAGFTARFQDCSEALLRVRATWRKGADETSEDIHHDLLEAKILALDDLGKQTTPEGVEFFSTLINARINLGRPTVCTTNHDLDTPEGRTSFYAACDARIYERYQRFHVAVKGGDNLRLKP